MYVRMSIFCEAALSAIRPTSARVSAVECCVAGEQVPSLMVVFDIVNLTLVDGNGLQNEAEIFLVEESS